MTTSASGSLGAATAAPGLGAPPPPAIALDTIVLTYCAVICAAFERRPSSSNCTLVGRPAARSAEKPLCSTRMPTTCSRSRALPATASAGYSGNAVKLREPRRRSSTSAAYGPRSRSTTPRWMFFTSMVAADEKMNSWMMGGSSSENRARGSRSMVMSSFLMMASSRCSTAHPPSVDPLVQPPPGDAEEQRADREHEQHVGNEHCPDVARQEHRLQRDVHVACRDQVGNRPQPGRHGVDVEQEPRQHHRRQIAGHQTELCRRHLRLHDDRDQEALT